MYSFYGGPKLSDSASETFWKNRRYSSFRKLSHHCIQGTFSFTPNLILSLHWQVVLNKFSTSQSYPNVSFPNSNVQLLIMIMTGNVGIMLRFWSWLMNCPDGKSILPCDCWMRIVLYDIIIVMFSTHRLKKNCEDIKLQVIHFYSKT